MIAFATGDIALTDGFLIRVWHADGTWAGDRFSPDGPRHGLTFGRDGALYYDDVFGDQIGFRLTELDGEPAGWGAQDYPPQLDAGGLAADATSSDLWVAGIGQDTAPATGSLTRIAPDGTVAASNYPNGTLDDLQHVAAGPGVVYFVHPGTGRNVLYRYDIASGVATVGVTFDAEIGNVAVSPGDDASVWVVLHGFDAPGLAGGGLWRGDSNLAEIASWPWLLDDDPYDTGGWDDLVAFNAKTVAVALAPAGDHVYVGVDDDDYGGAVIYRLDPDSGDGRDAPWVLSPAGAPSTDGDVLALTTRRQPRHRRSELRRRQQLAPGLRSRQTR